MFLPKKYSLAFVKRFPEKSMALADAAQKRALSDYSRFLGAATLPSDAIEALSPYAAMRAARHAIEHVSAYKQRARESGWRDDRNMPVVDLIKRLPITDKESYIKAFSTEERCVGGSIPLVGTQVDESAGSSGIPYNWVRSTKELEEMHCELSHFARLLYGPEVFTINAFSMGAWATGVNAGEALRNNGIVKSTGPDLEKILYTMEFFGPRYRYVITGYPPFLKHLIDEGEKRNFKWDDFTVFGCVGGEGMSEGLRDYLHRRFKAVYSGYGASDLDIGVAAELPLTVWIRRQARNNPQLKEALFGSDPRLPMLFQYNPLNYYIETNEENELIITINRMSVLSPRIRYNVHDAGGILPFDTMMEKLSQFGLDPIAAGELGENPVFHLPFMYLFGRSDSTLSYMGANIYPEDVEQALFNCKEDSRRLGAFSMELVELDSRELRPCIHVEVLEGNVEDADLELRLREGIVRFLLANNRDFQAAASEDRSVTELTVRLHGTGQGPFVLNKTKIKRRYIMKSAVKSEAAAT